MRKLLTCLFLICIMLFGFSSVSSAANWQWITSTEKITISFDPSRIREKDRDAYSVWVKNEYSSYYGKEFAETYKLKKPVSYNLLLFEFSYKSEGYRVLSCLFYADDGSIIDSYNRNPVLTNFEPIIPDSVGEDIFNATFKEYKAQYGKK